MSSVDTMSRWPVQVQDLSTLPPRYAESFAQNTGARDFSSMYAVFAPLVEFLWYRRGGQLLCIEGETLHFFRPAGSVVAYAKLHPRDVVYIRKKECLLSSDLEFAAASEGSPVKLSTEYNTVREELYEPVLDFFRGPKRESSAIIKERDEKYMHLMHDNFKLLNMGTRAYDRGSGSDAHVLQGPIRLQDRWFRKKVTSGILFISTADEFIAVEDIEHGTEYYYMRKSAIRDARTACTEQGYKILTIGFDGSKLTFPLTEESEEALRKMILRV